MEPQTSQEWATWLQEEERRAIQLYTDYPERLISDGNQERQVARDYAGREILELLQNANDAASEAEICGRVLIELRPTGLLVANDGAPFTRKGVASLKLANFSPKRSRRRQMVGNKGLGFRAVLNWSRTPIVLSGGLALAFNSATAQARQDLLAASDERIRDMIRAEQRTAGSLIVPILTFPGFAFDGDVGRLLDCPAQHDLYARATELRTQGYRTIVLMPFDNPSSAVAEAKRQLARLRPEVLLFARNISELGISELGKTPACWRHEPDGAAFSRVHVSEGQAREWRIFHDCGPVPKRLWPADRPGGMDFEIIVAVPVGHHATETLLYSYYPTELSFPYPLIAHATLDLQANRQQPQDTIANHFILRRLARLVSEAAATLANERDDDSGLLILATSASSDPLEKFQFRERLRRFARRRALVPTSNAGLVAPDAARRTAFLDNAWLPKQRFARIARVRDERATAVLKWLGVKELTSSEWASLTGDLTFEHMDDRADYIVGLVQHQLTEVMGAGGLLLDSKGGVVPANYRVFVATGSDAVFNLPPWFEACFMAKELESALRTRLKPARHEQFVGLLAPLGVSSYSFTGVVDGIVRHANRRLELEPDKEGGIREEVVRALFGLFSGSEPQDVPPKFPGASRVLLRTMAGTYEQPRKLYFSESYGTRGKMLHDLYFGIGPEKLLGSPRDHGLDDTGEALTRFFSWLGIADLPQEIRLVRSSVEQQFVDHVQKCLTYPLVIGEFRINTAQELHGHCTEVVSLDDLPELLATAPPQAVLAWLAIDPRTQHWKILSREHGTLKFDPGGRYHFREYDGGIPSYIRWKLQSSPWLQSATGSLVCPRDCLIEPLPALSRLLPTPALPSKEALLPYGVQRSQMFSALDSAGAMVGFSHIQLDQLYEILLKLPEIDPGGAVAKSVYEAALHNFNSRDARESTQRARFVQCGAILARKGADVGYCAVADAWRLGAEELPLALRQTLHVAEIPKFFGAERVESLLGVKSVQPGQVVRRIHGFEPAVDAIAVDDEIQRFLKPLVRRLRRARAERERDRRAFENLRVLLCKAVAGEVEFLGNVVPLDLECWGWIIDQDTAYLLTDPAQAEPMASPFFAHAVGEIFAEVLGLEQGTEFAQLAQCRRSDRLALLRRLIGETTLPDWDQLEAEYLEQLAQGRELLVPSQILKPNSVVVAPPLPTSPDTPAPKPPAPIEPEPHVQLQVEQKVHVPVQPNTVAIKVTNLINVGTRRFVQYERVSGDFCEAKVEEFEESQGRFPLRVGQVTGWSAPGVDILSFDSAENLLAFQAAERKDDSTIARFIEVKGRRDTHARIDLRDNELAAALRYGQRYFLYRLCDYRDGTFGLAILQDPLAARAGLKQFYELSLDEAKVTERFDLREGLNKDEYVRSLNAATRTGDSQ